MKIRKQHGSRLLIVLCFAGGWWLGIGLPGRASAQTLSAALDQSWPFTTGGDANWEGQTAITADGVDAARSGAISHNQTSFFEIVRPFAGGYVGFWAKVSSQPEFDFFRFSIDGVQQGNALSGEVDWTALSFPIADGWHTLRWQYSKDLNGSSGSDAAWVDQIVYFALPTVMIAATEATATEGGTTGTFAVTRTGDTTLPLTVSYILGGTAIQTSDYTVSPASSVTIPAGATTAAITVTAVNDTVQENDETVVATLSAGTLYAVGASASATVTIMSDDLPTVTITPTDSTATEAGPTTGRFTLMRTLPNQAALTVSYTLGGTATAGSDYTVSPAAGTVTFPAGAATATVTLTPIDDTAVEASETVVATIAPNGAYNVGSPATATIAIADNDSIAIALAEAVDQPSWTLAPTGSAAWSGQNGTTHDGIDAGRSGPISDGQSSGFETQVFAPSPIQLSFFWKVSSEAAHDFLSVSLDGVEQASISGVVDWEQKTLLIPAGTHALRWTYAKDASVSALEDAGWVDQVAISSLTVTYPTKPGISLKRGAPATITWSSIGDAAGALVKIELYKGVEKVGTISPSTPNTGSFACRISARQTAGADYRIAVTSLSNPAISDSSDAFFVISGGPMLTLTTPSLAGSTWGAGERYAIKWKKSGDAGRAVRISLYKGAAKVRTVVASTPNNGRFSWKVPVTLKPGSDYRMHIKSTTKSTVWDFSDYYCTMRGPSTYAPESGSASGLRIVSTRGARYRLEWDPASYPVASVKVELCRGGDTCWTIEASTPNDGLFVWQPPANLEPGDDYLLKVSSTQDPALAAFLEKPISLGSLGDQPWERPERHRFVR